MLRTLVKTNFHVETVLERGERIVGIRSKNKDKYWPAEHIEF